MDQTDPDIKFDENGISNHWHDYFKRLKPIHKDPKIRDTALNNLIDQIKKNGRNKEYDCIVGFSGGIDSTYVCYLTKNLGLRPLLVHFDNGWNSNKAKKNISRILDKLGLNIFLYEVDWNEFKNLQLSFLKASTPDCDIPNDHGMIALLYRMAFKYKVKYILTGINSAQESVLPLKWGYGYFDLKYIKSINKKFSKVKLKTYPKITFLKLFYYSKIKGIRFIPFLDYFEYDKEKAAKVLKDELNFIKYDGKHFESIYTRFIQSFILPKKFNIDKRKAHFSNMICSGQMTKKEALFEMKKDIYPSNILKEDKDIFLKKLELTENEFDNIMKLPPKLFIDYPNNYYFFESLKLIKRIFKRIIGHKIFEIE